jgi:flagellar secretion chaperone FliS
MHCSRGAEAYRQTDLQTMSKEKLIVLLYQKVLEHLAAASDSVETDRCEMARRLGLAQRIITELRGALDHAVGGEVADNLAALYEFVFKEILHMHVDKDPVHVANCRQVLLPLLDAWSSIQPGAGERELQASRKEGTDHAPADQANDFGSEASRDPSKERFIMTIA